MREFAFTVSPEEEGAAALNFLRSHGFSRRMVLSLKAAGGLTRGGAILRSIDRVHAGDVITVKMTDGGGAVPNAALSVKTAYEDEDIIIYDKPPFMVVHPSAGHYDDTLANAFAAAFPDTAFRSVNRLDRDTSGLCVCAKNRFAAAGLSGLKKVYFAAVDGIIEHGGVIDAPIARQNDSLIVRCVRSDGKPAVTHYEPVLCRNGRTLLKIRLETGRTHQIRVHFAHIGLPLCGDEMYGGDMKGIGRQALHCGEVCFIHPLTKEEVSVASEIPDDIKGLFGDRI